MSPLNHFSQAMFSKAFAMVSPTTKSSAAATQQEMKAAAELVLGKEEKRIRRAEMRARRQRRKREKEQLAAVQRMQQSIELMKWCIVSITAIMFLGIVLAIWTLSAVHDEVVKVQSEVDKIRPDVERVINEVNEVVDEVEKVREALRNPMQSIGSAFGAELDAKLNNFMGSRMGAGDE